MLTTTLTTKTQRGQRTHKEKYKIIILDILLFIRLVRSL